MVLRGIELEKIQAMHSIKSQGKNLENPLALFSCNVIKQTPLPLKKKKKAINEMKQQGLRGFLTKNDSASLYFHCASFGWGEPILATGCS